MSAGWPDEATLATLDEKEVLADPYGMLGSLIDFSFMMSAALPAWTALAGLSADQAYYLRSYVLAATKSERTPFLLRALFVSAVGFVEPLVTRLVELLLFRNACGSYESLADPRLDEDALTGVG
jgi:hypothetical protein